MCMPETLPARKPRRLLILKVLIAVVAGILGGGAWLFLNYHASRVVTVPITHSTPVGGKIEDGVYRSLPDTAEPGLTRWQI